MKKEYLPLAQYRTANYYKRIGAHSAANYHLFKGWLLVIGARVTTRRFTSNTSEVQTATVEDIKEATK